MGFKAQLLKVIEWKDPTQTTIVHRVVTNDRYAIMAGSRLIVNESQSAIFTAKGQIADVFGPGTYTLDTGVIPILSKICNWRFSFENPKEADVYYVNTKQFTDVKWGTTNPIMMRDVDFGVIRLRGYGNFSFRVADPATFMREIFGTVKTFETADIQNYLKNIILSTMTDSLGEGKIPALDLAANYMELADMTKNKAEDKFARLGLEITEVFIQNLSLPAEVEKALDERTTLGVFGDKMGQYQQYNATKAMRDMAAKPSYGGVADIGMGMGAGIAMGKMMAKQFDVAGSNQNDNKQNAKSADLVPCVKCGAMIRKGVKFCPECGVRQGLATIECPNCGAEIKVTAKFCPECGTPIKRKCPNCGAEIKGRQKFCPECGQKL